MRGVANRRLQFVAVEIGGGDAAGGPDQGGDAGDDIRQARRAAAQRLQDLADIGAVVIGGAARRVVVVGPVWSLRFVVEQIDGDRRNWAGLPSAAVPKEVLVRGSLGRTLSASWMAESASSVASLDFCGLFAISVVASLLRWTIAAAANHHDQRAAPRAREPPDLRKSCPPAPFYPQVFILSPWQCERNRRW